MCLYIMDSTQKRKLIQVIAAILLISCLIFVVITFLNSPFGWFILFGALIWLIAQLRSDHD